MTTSLGTTASVVDAAMSTFVAASTNAVARVEVTSRDGIASRGAHRHPHRRRRLSRLERRHPRGLAALVAAGPRDGRRPRGVARPHRAQARGARPAADLGHPARAAARSSARRAPIRSGQDGGVDRVLDTFADAGLDALVAIGGEDTLGVAARLHAEHGVPGRRRPEDDRQRPVRNGLHVRLRHRGHDRDRGDRPAAHDGGVAQPRDGRRGDGASHGLDRRAWRHRRRRRRDPRSPSTR